MKKVAIIKINSLLGKILLALLASTLLALLLVSIIQRSGFKQGLSHFLQQQEEVQLSFLVPELQDWYRRESSWESLRGDTRRWLRLLARTRPEGITPPEDALLEQPPPRGKERRRLGSKPDNSPPPDELRRLWRRIFLLDEQRIWVAGARPKAPGSNAMQAIKVGGSVVGWLGFVSAPQLGALRLAVSCCSSATPCWYRRVLPCWCRPCWGGCWRVIYRDRWWHCMTRSEA